MLGHVTDLFPEGDALACDFLTEHLGCALRRFKQTQEQTEEGRFSGPVGPDEGDRSRGNRYRKPRKTDDRPVAFGERIGADQVHEITLPSRVFPSRGGSNGPAGSERSPGSRTRGTAGRHRLPPIDLAMRKQKERPGPSVPGSPASSREDHPASVRLDAPRECLDFRKRPGTSITGRTIALARSEEPGLTVLAAEGNAATSRGDPPLPLLRVSFLRAGARSLPRSARHGIYLRGEKETEG